MNKAIDYFEKSIELKQKLNDKQGLVASYENLGALHLKNNNFNKAINQLNKSVYLEQVGI